MLIPYIWPLLSGIHLPSTSWRGLGSAIAQEIVAAHGGKISLQSQLGQGTVITVSLPLKQENTFPVSARK
jgi:nitrogen-specific signal transduction histidine kinase